MSTPQFSLPDSLQAGVAHLSKHVVPVLKRHWLAIVAATIALTILRRLISSVFLSSTFNALSGRNMSFGDIFGMVVLTLFVIAISLATVAYLIAAAQSNAAEKGEDDYAWQWGSAEPPLLSITNVQVDMLRSSLRRILSLWPGLVFLLFWGAKAMLDMQIRLRFGNAPAEMVWMRNLFLLAAIVFLLWYVGRLAQVYLFRAAVIVETGRVDEQQIAAWVPGRFPTYLKTSAYWNCAALLLAAMGLIWAIRWVLDQVYGWLDVERAQVVPQLFSDAVSFFAWAVAAVFLAGALRHAWVNADRSPETPDHPNPTDSPEAGSLDEQ